MDEQLIGRILPELRNSLVGLALREVFQLGESRYVIAFEGEEFRLLFVSIEPREPRIYLIRRRLKDLKRTAANPTKFAVDLAKALKGKALQKIAKFESERVIELIFEHSDGARSLVAQLTGKSANLFLLDSGRHIIAAARKPSMDEQSIGMEYTPPFRAQPARSNGIVPFDRMARQTISEQLDEHFQQLESQNSFNRLAATARQKGKEKVSKLLRLAKNLDADLAEHGDADRWKRYGDLLLANQSTAKRVGNFVSVPDIFDETVPLVEIEVAENESVTEAAQKYFRKYTKAKNAAEAIARRMQTVHSQIEDAERFCEKIEEAIETKNVEFLNDLTRDKKNISDKRKSTPRLPAGIRSFSSSDNFEILVGKKATDNDVLTFKVANSRDTWMHAADYPGSHVVVRNADRKEIPQTTLIEAAQLAAFYSQGKKQPKAAVHYTLKKFVNKPKGGNPGLVRLASFKTILVEPIFPSVSRN
ncbi:MAG: NFACT RNA binding domain-containing protein [Pyrinomonadaceae bacterium]